MSLKSNVLAGLKWSAFAKLTGQIISWASTLVVIRLLHPDDYGLMSIAMIFTALCFVLSQLGLGTALIQAKDAHSVLTRQVYSVVIYSNILIFLGLYASAPAIAGFFDQEQLTTILRVQSVQYLIGMFGIVPLSLLTRKMDFRRISIIELIAFMANTVTTLSLAWNGFGVWSLVFGTLAEGVVKSVLTFLSVPYLVVPTLNFKGFASAAKYGGFTSLDYMLWYTYSNSDRFVIGKLMDTVHLGIYTVAMQLASLPLEKMGAIINQVAIPAYAKIQDDLRLVANYTLKVTAFANVLTFPVFLGISCTASVFVPLIIGDKWLETILPIELLALIGPLRVNNGMLQPALAGIGRPKDNVINLAVACVMIPTGFVIGVNWGLAGVCYSWLISFGLWYLFMTWRVLPLLGVVRTDYFERFIAPVLASVLMYALVEYVEYELARREFALWAQLGVMVLTGGAFYLLFMIVFFRKYSLAVVELIRDSR